MGVTPLGRLSRMGFTRGVLGGSRPWLYIGLAATTTRALRRLARASPRTVLLEELEPGEALEIRVLPPRPR